MRKRVTAAMTGVFATVLTLGGAGQSQAESGLVVVELYTSQGCSSCPPADALLAELATRDDVMPLALHVDYWDYIGWKDVFANPAFTKRQKAYAQAAGKRMIYTPQMIVGGTDHVVGNKPMRLAKLIEDHHALAAQVQFSVARQGDHLQITAEAKTAGIGDLVVQMVRYIPSESVDIGRGENAGLRISYSNIVTDWQVLGNWDGVTPLSMQAKVDGSAPIVVLLQEAGHGAILAAERFD